MSGYFQQPWNRVTVCGHECKVQVLDPETAFKVEPEIVETLGEELAMALSSPHEILGRIWGSVAREHGLGGSLREVLADERRGAKVAADGLTLMAKWASTLIRSADLDGRWLAGMFADLLFERLTINGLEINSWADLDALDPPPELRWRLLSFQLGQTFTPLWLRSPYSVRQKRDRKSPTESVPLPHNVSKAAQWAGALVTQGQAPSPHEVLTRWTPAQLIDAVETAAYHAEVERRAYDAAKARD